MSDLVGTQIVGFLMHRLIYNMHFLKSVYTIYVATSCVHFSFRRNIIMICLLTETAMGKSVNAQGNENSEYVQAVYK